MHLGWRLQVELKDWEEILEKDGWERQSIIYQDGENGIILSLFFNQKPNQNKNMQYSVIKNMAPGAIACV